MTSIPPDLLASTRISPAHRADMELAAKYACEGPRYTSYPTAPQFRQDFPLDQYLAWQARNGDVKLGSSIGRLPGLRSLSRSSGMP